jgi:osmoprotectant transport system permease protein
MVAALWACLTAQAADMHVGSKRFTESYILGEIVAQRARASTGQQVTHKQGLGNTAIVFAALKSGAIDVYPDYTGTIAFELLGLKTVPGLPQLNAALTPHGVAVGIPLGFGNSYALAMPAARAKTLGISRISDLAQHRELRLGLTQEFLNRKDGWQGLRAAYGLTTDAANVKGLDHGVAYAALKAGSVDVIDVYTTDAQIERQGLTVLTDDRGYFPPYEAVLLYRADFPARHPAAFKSLATLQEALDTRTMLRMNAAAELDGQPFASVAADYLAGRAGTPPKAGWWERLWASDFWRLTAEHGALVSGALLLSVVTGVPLGVWAARSRRARPWVLGAAGVLQTIPSLALLAFLVAALGTIGPFPAVIALFLYGLLPIVRNTESGLRQIPHGLTQAGFALGLRGGEVTRLIELPLALPSILAGIKTSTVINVGTATIAAFVGAGGYGERIVAGLAVNDPALMLAGAIPSAGLALVMQGLFEIAERRMRHS